MMASGAASFGSAGVRVHTSSKVCTMCTPTRLLAPPAHFTQRQSSCKAGADHQARWAGARGGRSPSSRSWSGGGRTWTCGGGGNGDALGERERRWRGLGLEEGYGRRGEREGQVDTGRGLHAWRRLGEREWWSRGLGVLDGYGRRGERGARWGLWGEGEEEVGRRWRAWRRRGERERWWRGLGVGVAYGGRGEREVRWGPWGEGEVDMGRPWRARWRPGERKGRERGPRGFKVAPGGPGAARVGG